jgi:hypothetical protein
VPLVEHELLTLPEHLSSPLVFSGVHVNRSLVLCVCFADRCLSFCLLAIVLSVLLRIMPENGQNMQKKYSFSPRLSLCVIDTN